MIRPGDGGPFGRGWVLHRIYVVCQIFLAVVLLAFIVGSLIFTGGRVGEAQNTNWDEVWRWPVFPVPAWILIVPAIVRAFVVLPMCIRTPAARANILLGAVGPTFAAGGSAVLFMFLFPADDGPFPMPDPDDGSLGWHWVALVPTVFSLVVLIIAVAVKGREYERIRLSGGASW